MKRALLLLSLILFSSISILAGEGRLLRFPAVSADQIAFCHGGDIYVVPLQGGIARQITSHEGEEMFPRFSPDGNKIAFSAEYDGNREVYTMDSDGSLPVRLTFSMDAGSLPERMGPDKIVMQWTADGTSVVYRSRKESWNPWIGKLYKVDIDGSLPTEIPLPRSGFCSLSPDATQIAYNRVFREFRTWKRYRGGMADEIWLYNFADGNLENLTDNPAQDIIPMWHGDKIYFLSDREHEMNIFCYDIQTKTTRKITDFKDYDCKFPSLGPSHIAFENGGYIYLLDLATEKYEKVNIELGGDYPQLRRQFVDASGRLAVYDISPDGQRAVVDARGDLFSVPRRHGNTFNLTKTSGAHERQPVWSPDGKWIAYISDADGEDEVYIKSYDNKETIQLTKNAVSYRFALKWSPDSKKLLCSDKSFSVYYIDIESKKTTQITKSKCWEIRDFDWSPDSKWVAYVDYINNYQSIIYLYSTQNSKSYLVTDLFFSSEHPEFSSDGKYLFFQSDRTFRATTGAFEWNFTYNDMTKIYGLTLQDTLMSPFGYQNDEVQIGKAARKKKQKDNPGLRIDIEGISDRLFELPVSAGNYYGLHSVGDKLYYLRDGSLCYYDFEDREEKNIGSIPSFVISGDGKSIMFRKAGKLYIDKLDDKITADNSVKLNLSGLEMKLDRREEWTQVYNEAWRQMKHFFYDPNMHGVDWEKIRTKYAAMLPYVVHRCDLTYLIGEMIGELNCGHSYVGGGDRPKVDKIAVGSLGIDYEYDSKSGFYRITKILDGRNWEEKTRSPLTEPGIDIKAGDYLVSIDGMQLSKKNHPGRLLVNKARKYIALVVNDKPSAKGGRKYDVKTIANESELRYYNWVEERRAMVDEATKGRVGYVHIPDMGMHGLHEFVKYFYPQIRKEALVIDDRYNGGGNVSPMVIERLRRVLALAKHVRNQTEVQTNPTAVMPGPMVCLLNEYSTSDGDLFPYQFKNLGLGQLVGKRSWGGVIGIRGSLPFVDGSYLNRPEFANFGADGSWVLEGVGMAPDIVVDNSPALEYKGKDQQLEKAIEVILLELQDNKKTMRPDVPEFPVKK